MSQVLSETWGVDSPVYVWETPSELCESGEDKWPDLISDRLTISDKVGWHTIVSQVTVFHATELYEQLALDFDVADRFRKLADQWHNETGHYSLTFKRAMHPAYQQIIGMGRNAIPLILADLRERPTGHWFWALGAITGEDPTLGESDIDKAIEAWLKWRPKS